MAGELRCVRLEVVVCGRFCTGGAAARRTARTAKREPGVGIARPRPA